MSEKPRSCCGLPETGNSPWFIREEAVVRVSGFRFLECHQCQCFLRCIYWYSTCKALQRLQRWWKQHSLLPLLLLSYQLTHTSRFRDSFFPRTVRLLNSCWLHSLMHYKHPGNAAVTWWPITLPFTLHPVISHTVTSYAFTLHPVTLYTFILNTVTLHAFTLHTVTFHTVTFWYVIFTNEIYNYKYTFVVFFPAFCRFSVIVHFVACTCYWIL